MGIKQRSKSLRARGNELSDTFFQLRVLNGQEKQSLHLPLFSEKIAAHGWNPLRAEGISTLQINVGKRCNQSCAHCHVDAGPERTEAISRKHLERCLEILAHTDISTVDLTGGAPEMHPDFRWFVSECRQLGKKVMNRCNLTILVAHEKYADLPEFFAKHRMHVVSSLPHYAASRTDGQRGEGVFDDSIRALRRLNEVGYGRSGTGLVLDLVYNPSGAFLPDGQEALEAEFKRQLERRHGIVFDRLYCIANMPISRFLDYLLESGNYTAYMEKLVAAFNPSTVSGVMCRNTLSVGWDGRLYDCDFNQMLDLPVQEGSNHLDHFDADTLNSRSIVVNQHCYGCTAGAGSSCGGAVVS
jgi:radical SAM/Cys-rich protein